MTTLEEQINNQKKYVLEQKRQIMEANAELLLEHAFRRNDMNMGAEVKTTEPKAFESITKTLTKCKEISKQLSVRSRELVRLLTGMEKPSKDSAEKLKKVDSVVLIHVLQDIEVELCQNLSEISDNLEKLEKAW